MHIENQFFSESAFWSVVGAAEAEEMFIEEFNKSCLGSVFSYQPAQIPKKIENTYRLGPKHKVLESEILKAISFAQKTVLTDLKKDDQPLLKTRTLLLKLLDLVRLQLKSETKLNRYKTIVTGFVGKDPLFPDLSPTSSHQCLTYI